MIESTLFAVALFNFIYEFMKSIIMTDLISLFEKLRQILKIFEISAHLDITRVEKIKFLLISSKVSTLGYMLLYKSYINVMIAVILS